MDKKRFRFPKGVDKVRVPFMLNDFSPWQQQIAVEVEKTKKRLGTSKRTRFSYEIVDGSAEICIYKV